MYIHLWNTKPQLELIVIGVYTFCKENKSNSFHWYIQLCWCVCTFSSILLLPEYMLKIPGHQVNSSQSMYVCPGGTSRWGRWVRGCCCQEWAGQVGKMSAGGGVVQPRGMWCTPGYVDEGLGRRLAAACTCGVTGLPCGHLSPSVDSPARAAHHPLPGPS